MTNIQNSRLIDFVQQISDIHAGMDYGFFREDQERCKRWMDAILPEVPSNKEYKIPFDDGSYQKQQQNNGKTTRDIPL